MTDDSYPDLPKLVRDRIPAIVRDDGDDPVTERVSDDEAERWLREKLVEEAREFAESGDIEELADVLAVMERYVDITDIDWSRIEDLQAEKETERGGFDDNVVLQDID